MLAYNNNNGVTMSSLASLWFECASNFPRRDVIFSCVSSKNDLLKHNDSDGRTALHILAESSSLKDAANICADLFDAYSIDPNEVKDNTGEVLFATAVRSDNVSLVKTLLKHGQDLGAKDCDGNDFLSLAVITMSYDTVLFLLPSFRRFKAKSAIVKLMAEEIYDSDVIDACVTIFEEEGMTEHANELVELVAQSDIQVDDSSKPIDSIEFEQREGKGLVPIYSQRSVIERLDEVGETESSARPYLMRLCQQGPFRPVVSANEGMIDGLNLLLKRFPHFKSVINYIKQHLVLCLGRKNPYISIPPVLLEGNPGIGKTKFIRELAKILEVDFLQIDCANLSPSVFISGEPAVFRDASPGKFVQYFKNGGVANPMVLLDEIDKSKKTNGSDFSPFYGLLEKDSAKSFEDAFCQVEFNYSNFMFFCSANDADLVPDAILSRLTVFYLEKPTLKQMPSIVRSIYSELVAEEGFLFSREISDESVAALSSLYPREVKHHLQNAMGVKALEKYLDSSKAAGERISLDANTINTVMQKNQKREKRRAMGF